MNSEFIVQNITFYPGLDMQTQITVMSLVYKSLPFIVMPKYTPEVLLVVVFVRVSTYGRLNQLCLSVLFSILLLYSA